MVRRGVAAGVLAGVLVVTACSSTARRPNAHPSTAVPATTPAVTTAPVVPVPPSPGTSTPPVVAPTTAAVTEPSEVREATSAPTPGDGLGDQPFPELGNPGIDVQHYDLDVRWDPVAGEISGSVVLTILPTEDRPAFTLDADASVEVGAVTVDGTPAVYAHEVPELRITPASGLRAGRTVSVVVTYTARPVVDDRLVGHDGGWLVGPIGTYTINEPDTTRTWIPSNDHPSDKATWTFAITVPTGTTAVANGRLAARTDGGRDTTWTWETADPMATYLVQVLTGPYELVEADGPDGVELVSAVYPRDRAAVQPALDGMSDMLSFFADRFGPYPFDSYGLAVADSIPNLAIEHQTRSMFPRSLFLGGSVDDQQFFLAHEMAHQWFGDAVTPASWQDVWLNESFATYAQWLWAEDRGGDSVEQAAARALRLPRQVLPARPGRELFGSETYEAGAVVLHALRRRVGDELFFAVLREWVATNRGTSRTTDDFEALAARVTGQDLTEFFDEWLWTTRPPTTFP